jgi:hypothetical protein
MGLQTFSLKVSCWRDPPTNTTQLQVVWVDTGEEIKLKDASFIIRIFSDGATIERGLIRHIASGREAFIQSGAGLRSFIEDCLLNLPEPPAGQP